MGLSPSAVFGLNYKFRLNRGGGAQPRPRSAEGKSMGVETAWCGPQRSEDTVPLEHDAHSAALAH